MIKGHVCIDLHNHNSGFTERIEKDNMVTNAIQQCLIPLGMSLSTYTPERMSASQNKVFDGYCSFNSLLFPLCQVGLGGLMLFDGKLRENKNNVQFPTDVHLVGFGGSGINTSSPTKGSLNYTDTKYSDDGRSSTRVWDFATNQANGKIASLSLTHEIEGSRGPINHSLNAVQFPKNYIPIKYDKTNHTLYVLAYTGTTYSDNKRHWTFDLYTQYNHLETITINQDYRSILNSRLNKVASWTVNSPSSNNSYDRGYDNHSMFIIKNKVYFLYINDYHNSTNYSIVILSASINDIVNSKNNTVWTSTEFVVSDGWGPFGSSMVTNDAIYLRSHSYGKWYRITYNMLNGSFNNTTPLSSFPAEDLWTKYSTWSPSVINNCHYDIRDNNYYIVYDDGTVVNLGNASNTPNLISFDRYCVTYLDDESIFGILTYANSDAGGYIGITSNYLGTICNLSEPVTKTESTSMKVTYTLSAV